jgi:hypothetical protein
LGTRKDNMQDAKNKGRTSQGERHSEKVRGELCGAAKLTEENVLFIRSSSSSNLELSKLFGVHPDTIKHVRQGKTWRHIGGL